MTPRDQLQVDVHEISSHLIRITTSAQSYKKMLKDDLLEILVKKDGEWIWKSFRSNVPENVGSSREYKYDTFDDYLSKWSNFDYDDLVNLFSDDMRLRDLLRDAKYGGLALWGAAEGNQNASKDICENEGSNVTSVIKRGDGIEYTMARLERDYPEYHEKVKSGELSANAAAIEAGFRKPPLTPFEGLLKNWNSATSDDRARFLATVGAQPVSASASGDGA